MLTRLNNRINGWLQEDERNGNTVIACFVMVVMFGLVVWKL